MGPKVSECKRAYVDIAEDKRQFNAGTHGRPKGSTIKGELAGPQSDRIPLFFYFLKGGESLGKAVTNLNALLNPAESKHVSVNVVSLPPRTTERM